MSEQESNLCEICGGMTRIAYTIEFRQCVPHSISVEPNQVVVPHMRLCPGHPEPAQKHDGKLGEDEHVFYQSYPSHTMVSIQAEIGEITPGQALSLLDWLLQERGELARLAKEQGE